MAVMIGRTWWVGCAWLACLAPALLVTSLRASAWVSITCGVLAAIPYAFLLLQIRRQRAFVPAIWAVGLVARALSLAPEDGLSDDVFRYLWEGRVVVAGENPYEHAPDDPALAHLRDSEIWPLVTHAAVPAAYPPLAQGFFAAVHCIWPTPRGMRAALLLIDLLVWIALARLLRAGGLDPGYAALWGLSPLVILEIGGSGHVDVLTVLFSLLAFLAVARGRALVAAAMLAFATLFKPYAVVLAPVLAVRTRWLAQGALFGAILVSGYLPFASHGSPTSGLQRYSLEWTHNAVLYAPMHRVAEGAKDVVTRVLERRGYSHSFRSHFYSLDPNVLARVALGGLWLLAACWILRAGGAREARGAALLAALALLSPTVHPWYLLWFLPLLAFRADLGGPMLLWSVTVLFSYHVLPQYDALGLWEESRAWRAAEYVPVFLWFAVVAWRRSKAGRSEVATGPSDLPKSQDPAGGRDHGSGGARDDLNRGPAH